MQFSAAQIAPLLDGIIEGDSAALVSDFGKIESAKAGDLAFLANPKYEAYAYSTEATILLVSKDFAPRQEVKATLNRVADPYAALAKLMQLVEQQQKPRPEGISPLAAIAEGVALGEDVYIGAFAVIEAGARIGKGSLIYPHAYIGAGVQLGEDSIVYPHATLYHGVEIGARCIIHAGAVIGADGFGFAPKKGGGWTKIPQLGAVVIGNRVEIGACTCIDRGALDDTVIEDGCKIDNLVQIAHNVRIGADTAIAACAGIAGSAVIGKRVQIGGASGIFGHISICDDAVVSTMTLISKSITKPAFYSGIFPSMENADWERAAAVVRQLPDMRRRLRRLEQQVQTAHAGTDAPATAEGGTRNDDAVQ